MPPLDSKLRSQLDSICQKAREKAEEAARGALHRRGVDAAEAHAHFSPAERKLRNRLRAHGRQIGDVRQANKKQTIDALAAELAYETWHRMLFARFLAENHLLMHPDGVPVSLEECAELAASEGEANAYSLAARYASKMLPQVFRMEDVLQEVELAPEHQLTLERLLTSLPRETFLADDSLGWVYQFWQTKRKKEVNESGAKIDGKTLPAVTQLFTEDYMVQFLLQNTIGAWWCARQGITGAPGGAGIPAGKAPVEMPYLRWRDDGTPAAGSFEGWPKTLRDFTMLDPCCGSGHFLVAAFNLLVPLRMQDEGLSAREAADAVLRENLFGLELDPRCTQIAAFALAFAAWKYPDSDGEPLGYRELPPLNIACSGIGPQATEEEWIDLARQSGLSLTALSKEPVLNGLRHMHGLFSHAPTLGSLIDPNELPGDLITADFETLKPYLDAALKSEKADEEAHERAVAAAGMVKAAELLAGEYTLVATNVPYLQRGNQNEIVQTFCQAHLTLGKSNLATAFLLRWHVSARTGAFVTPQSWLYQPTYSKLRNQLLLSASWRLLARLGPGAFETISGEVVNVCLFVSDLANPKPDQQVTICDVTRTARPTDKAAYLVQQSLIYLSQLDQLNKPGCIISSFEGKSSYLEDYAISFQGIKTGDDEKLRRCFWEIRWVVDSWTFYQSTVRHVSPRLILESLDLG